MAESEDWLVTTSRDRTVRVWSLRHSSSSGEDQGMTYKHHKKTVQQAQLINQSKVVSCDNSTIHVWDPTTGQQVKKKFEARFSVLSCLHSFFVFCNNCSLVFIVLLTILRKKAHNETSLVLFLTSIKFF